MSELIVYQSLGRLSVCLSSIRQHFQTSSPLKPLGQLNSNVIWRLLRTGERKFVQMATTPTYGKNPLKSSPEPEG